MRRVIALVLSAVLACALITARIDEARAEAGDSARRAEFAIGVAVLVTGARVLAVLFAGNTIFGGRIATGLMVIYLGHVVAEGLIYGAAAGAGAFAVGHGTRMADLDRPPMLRPDRLGKPIPSRRLPLQLDHQYR